MIENKNNFIKLLISSILLYNVAVCVYIGHGTHY